MTPNRQSFASLYGLPESATWEQIYDTARELRTKQLSDPQIKAAFASLYGLPEDATWKQIFAIAKGEMEAASTDPVCGNVLAELAAYKKKYGGL